MDVFDRFPLNPRSAADRCLEHPIIFVERFWRWRDTLFVLAVRLLGDRRAASDAVEACFRKNCHHPPKFASDGAFGSWIVRALFDEALLARRQMQTVSRQSIARAGWADDFACLNTTV